jgi:hypothetical protein
MARLGRSLTAVPKRLCVRGSRRLVKHAHSFEGVLGDVGGAVSSNGTPPLSGSVGPLSGVLLSEHHQTGQCSPI